MSKEENKSLIEPRHIIEELKEKKLIDFRTGMLVGEELPHTREIMDKINEIIREVNKIRWVKEK